MRWRCPSPPAAWADENQPEQVAQVTRDGVFVSGFSVDADMQDAVGLPYCTTDGNLYISDDNASEVVVWTTGGTLVNRWSTLPCVDADAICHIPFTNTLFVGDDNAAIIYEFTLDGTLVNSYDLDALLGITGVDGLTVDPIGGNLFIGDTTTPYTVYEVSGFFGPVSVAETSWAHVKSLYRQASPDAGKSRAAPLRRGAAVLRGGRLHGRRGGAK